MSVEPLNETNHCVNCSYDGGCVRRMNRKLNMKVVSSGARKHDELRGRGRYVLVRRPRTMSARAMIARARALRSSNRDSAVAGGCISKPVTPLASTDSAALEGQGLLVTGPAGARGSGRRALAGVAGVRHQVLGAVSPNGEPDFAGLRAVADSFHRVAQRSVRSIDLGQVPHLASSPPPPGRWPLTQTATNAAPGRIELVAKRSRNRNTPFSFPGRAWRAEGARPGLARDAGRDGARRER